MIIVGRGIVHSPIITNGVEYFLVLGDQWLLRSTNTNLTMVTREEFNEWKGGMLPHPYTSLELSQT